jgi:hypothetical protein
MSERQRKGFSRGAPTTPNHASHASINLLTQQASAANEALNRERAWAASAKATAGSSSSKQDALATNRKNDGYTLEINIVGCVTPSVPASPGMEGCIPRHR